MANSQETAGNAHPGALDAHDFPDFAQEFLRRNKDYQLYHAGLTAAQQPLAKQEEDLPGRWGLCFPH